MSVNKEVVERIRERFLDSIQQNSELYVKSDVKRVEYNDWWIERFVLTTNSEEEALKALIKAMQWRKTFGVNDFNDDYFPEEIYKIGPTLVTKIDRDGRLVLWCNVPEHQQSDELELMFRQFLVYQIEKLDGQTSHEGWAVVIDPTNSDLSNIDLDLVFFAIDVLSYYPKGPKYHLVVDLPWINRAAAQLVLPFMDEHIRQCVWFITKAELLDYFDPDFLPEYMGGTFVKDFIPIPDEVEPLEQLPTF